MNTSVLRRDKKTGRSSSPDVPAVSVVMPAFNAERWIATGIESVLAQTLTKWELVIINDGSTDGTEAVARGFDDPRIHIINQENGGAAKARNEGFRNSRGRFIALLDADDWYEPRHLERATAFLDEHLECSLVGTNFHFIDYKGEKTLGCKPLEILGKAGDGVISDYFRASMRNRCFPITCCAVFRKERISELGEFDETLPSDEDHDFWTRWAMRSHFGYIDEPLSSYRVDTPGSNRKNLEASIRARVRLWKKLTDLESEDLPFWVSYARCRSFYLFRLTALAVATGQLDEVRQVSRYWPSSPSHAHWWLGKTLATLPDFCLRAIHAILGRTDLVKYRQGRPAPSNTNTP